MGWSPATTGHMTQQVNRVNELHFIITDRIRVNVDLSDGEKNFSASSCFKVHRLFFSQKYSPSNFKRKLSVKTLDTSSLAIFFFIIS